MSNSKTLLETYCKERHLQLPVYSTERADGSSGLYLGTVLVCGRNFDSQAIHSSIKLAEEDAARVAYNYLRQVSASASSRESMWTNFSSGSANQSAGTTATAESNADSARRRGPAPRPENGQANNADDYCQKLAELCRSRGRPAPEYDVKESSDGKFTASVEVGEDKYPPAVAGSYSEAKNYASLIALAEISLSLLNINERREEENLQRSDPVDHSRDDVHSPSTSPPPPYDHSTDIELPDQNYKAIVQEYCQKSYIPLPQYVTDYSPVSSGFVSVVTVCEKEYQSKGMATKKKAEQNAAGRAAVDMGLVTVSSGRDGYGARGQARRSVSPPNSVSGVGLASRSAGGSVGSPPSSAGGGGGIRSQRTAAIPENITFNYKGKLQEFLAQAGQANPSYNTTGYGRQFVSTVTLTDPSGETQSFQGKEYSVKRNAEQSAAKQACIHFRITD